MLSGNPDVIILPSLPIYCIRTNIGEELNLANYHAITKFKSRQYYSISLVTLVAFGVDIGLTSHSFHNKLGLQQIFDSFGYSLEFWYSNSKINIRYSFTYVL